MKPLASTLLTLLFLVGSATAQNQREPKPPHNHPDKPEMRKEAFLGIATGPIHESLRAQLNIDEGFGLLVHHVHSDSPAAEKLETHDIVTKLDDQLLVNQDQLSALVRRAGIGSTINLTFIRRGDNQTVAITLGEREAPHHRPMFHFQAQGGFDPDRLQENLQQAQERILEATERMHHQMREARERMEAERDRDREARERAERQEGPKRPPVENGDRRRGEEPDEPDRERETPPARGEVL